MILPDSLNVRLNVEPLLPQPDGRVIGEAKLYKVAGWFHVPQRMVIGKPPPWKGARSTARHHRQVKQRR